MAQECRGAQGWGAPPAAPPYGTDLKGDALAGVSGPSAGRLRHGLVSQGRAFPPVPAGAPLSAFLPFWENWTRQETETVPTPETWKPQAFRESGGFLHFT